MAAIIELVKGGMTNVLLCHHSFTQEYGDTHDVINGGEKFLNIRCCNDAIERIGQLTRGKFRQPMSLRDVKTVLQRMIS